MNSNLKKLFGFAAITACSFGFAMNVNAATATAGTDYNLTAAANGKNETCEALTSLGFEACASKGGNFKDVKKIEINATTPATEPVKVYAESNHDISKVDIEIKSSNTLEVYGKLKAKSVTNASSATSTGVNVKVGGSLTAEKLDVDTVVGESDKESGVANLTVNKDTLNASNARFEGTITAYGKSLIKATGGVTVDLTKLELNNAAGFETTTEDISIDEVELNDSSKFTAKDTNLDATTSVTVNDTASISVKDVKTGSLTVDGEGAKAEFQKYDAATAVEPTKGVIKYRKETGSKDKFETIVMMKGLDEITLLANEHLILKHAPEYLLVKGPNGAIIENASTTDPVKVAVNTKEKIVEIVKGSTENEYHVIGNGTDVKPGDDTQKPGDDTQKPGDDTQKPGDDTQKPGDNTQKPGDDQPSKNPQTFDAILSYVGVALTSIGGLGVSLKKRLFR